jgi:DNA-binding MarR family transcriptional regulator
VSAPSLASVFESDDDSTGLMLWLVTNRWQAQIRAILLPFGLTHVQFVLLAALAWLDSSGSSMASGSITQRGLADYAMTDPMMTSQVLRALEARGLVSREQHPTDGRAMLVGVTVEGLALVNRAIGAVEVCDARFFEPLGRGTAEFGVSLRLLARDTRPPDGR